MNSFYHDYYPAKEISDGTNGHPLSTIVLKRDIEYFTSEELQTPLTHSEASVPQESSPPKNRFPVQRHQF